MAQKQQHQHGLKHYLEDLLHEIKDTASKLSHETANYIKSHRAHDAKGLSKVKKLRDQLSRMKERLSSHFHKGKKTKESFENVPKTSGLNAAYIQSTLMAYKQCTDRFCGQLQADVLRKNQAVMTATLRMINISKKIVQLTFDYKLTPATRALKTQELALKLKTSQVAVINAIDKMINSTEEEKYLQCSVTNCKEITRDIIGVFRMGMPDAENDRAGNVSKMSNAQLVSEIRRKAKNAIVSQLIK